jgi:hypothetical protein
MSATINKMLTDRDTQIEAYISRLVERTIPTILKKSRNIDNVQSPHISYYVSRKIRRDLKCNLNLRTKYVTRYLKSDLVPGHPWLSYFEAPCVAILQVQTMLNPRGLCCNNAQNCKYPSWRNSVCKMHEKSMCRRSEVITNRFGKDVASIIMLYIGFRMY